MENSFKKFQFNGNIGFAESTSKYLNLLLVLKSYILCIMVVLITTTSCKNKEKMISNTEKGTKNELVSATQVAIVYKTIADFSNLVPVIMNSEKTKIISYPAPTDLYYNGKPSLPTVLKNGYLLDNRGINENVVFLKYTYNEYQHFETAPSISEMMTKIAEKYPLSELYYCGHRNQYKNEVEELNTIIDKGFLNCKKAYIIQMSVKY